MYIFEEMSTAITPFTAKKIDGLVEAKLGDLTVFIRESDGFFKVSKISEGSRHWGNWARTTGKYDRAQI